MGKNAKNPERREDTQGQEETHRAFIAVALPVHVTEALGELQQKLRDFGIRMKYTDPENIHLTLKFLGDIRASDVEAINAQLSAAAGGFSPMTLSAAGMGAFPSIRRPRVLWTGVAGQRQRLEALQQEVENAMAAIGFEKEDRRFSGHFTLGRFKGKADADRLADAIRQFGSFTTEEFAADAVHLFESTLTPKGPIYRKLASHPLNGQDT